MITKSLLILSIILNIVGLNSNANKFDEAIARDLAGSKKIANASSNNIILPEILPRPIIKPNPPKLFVNARHYYLVDAESGAMIAGESYKTRVPIASTTKIMTAIVVLENYKLDDVVTITPEAATQIGADTYLIPGEKISVYNLLNCMLIKSGNDSAYALAQYLNEKEGSDQQGVIDGENLKPISTAPFVQKMNDKAKELGMNDTDYHDPAGLDDSGYSTAYDLSIAARYAMRNETFREIVARDSYVAKNIDNTIYHDLKNSNRLVAEYKYPGALGIKTGYMPEAGHCLVGAAKQNDHTLISIVLNTYADTPSASADESARLLNWGFANTYWD